MKKAGVFIIIVGIGLMIFTTFSFFTKEKEINIAQVEIAENKLVNINWYPLIGLAVLGIGSIILGRSS